VGRDVLGHAPAEEAAERAQAARTQDDHVVGAVLGDPLDRLGDLAVWLDHLAGQAFQFAYVDKQGEGHLPINDASHVGNAVARFNQTEFESMAAKERARRTILTAAEKHGIEIDEGDNIRKSTRSLRAASTKRGPRGGRKED